MLLMYATNKVAINKVMLNPNKIDLFKIIYVT